MQEESKELQHESQQETHEIIDEFTHMGQYQLLDRLQEEAKTRE